MTRIFGSFPDLGGSFPDLAGNIPDLVGSFPDLTGSFPDLKFSTWLHSGPHCAKSGMLPRGPIFIGFGNIPDLSV